MVEGKRIDALFVSTSNTFSTCRFDEFFLDDLTTFSYRRRLAFRANPLTTTLVVGFLDIVLGAYFHYSLRDRTFRFCSLHEWIRTTNLLLRRESPYPLGYMEMVEHPAPIRVTGCKCAEVSRFLMGESSPVPISPLTEIG